MDLCKLPRDLLFLVFPHEDEDEDLSDRKRFRLVNKSWRSMVQKYVHIDLHLCYDRSEDERQQLKQLSHVGQLFSRIRRLEFTITGSSSNKDVDRTDCRTVQCIMDILRSLVELQSFSLQNGGNNLSGEWIKALSEISVACRLSIVRTPLSCDQLSHLLPLTKLKKLALTGISLTDTASLDIHAPPSSGNRNTLSVKAVNIWTSLSPRAREFQCPFPLPIDILRVILLKNGAQFKAVELRYLKDEDIPLLVTHCTSLTRFALTAPSINHSESWKLLSTGLKRLQALSVVDFGAGNISASIQKMLQRVNPKITYEFTIH